jgi:hypothetical protein
VTAAPLIPASRAVRLVLTAVVASRGVLAAVLGWFAVVAAVYASDAGPPLPAMAVTAAALLPIGAWAAAASLAALGPDLRALLTAADGRVRTLLVEAAVPLLLVGAAAVLGVLAALLFDPHSAPAGDRALGFVLHLLCGAVGVGLAFLLHALGLTRGSQAAVVVLATLFSARLRWVPPDGPVLALWGTGRHPGPVDTAVVVAGSLAVALALGAAATLVRRRRL